MGTKQRRKAKTDFRSKRDFPIVVEVGLEGPKVWLEDRSFMGHLKAQFHQWHVHFLLSILNVLTREKGELLL